MIGRRLALGPAGVRRSATPALVAAATAVGVLLAAVVTAPIFSRNPQIALAVPVVAVAAVAARRWPVAVCGLLFALSGSYGSVNAFTPVPAGSAIDVLITGLSLAVVWHLATDRRERALPACPGLLLLGLYVFVTFLEVATADARTVGLRAFHTSAWYAVAALAVAYSPWDERVHRQITRVLLGVVAAIAAYACVRYATGPAAQERELVLSQAQNVGYIQSGDLPLFGSFQSPKELGAWCAVVAPFAFVHLLGATGLARVFAGLACLLVPVALFGSDARLALLALVCGLVLALGAFAASRAGEGLRIGRSLVALGLVLVVGVGGFQVVHGDDPTALGRYRDLLHPNAALTVQVRRATWNDALRQIPGKPLGRGLGSSGIVAYSYGRFLPKTSAVLDNSYLQVALDQGVVVVVLVLAVLLSIAGLMRRGVLVAARAPAWQAIGAAGALLAFGVLMYGGVFLDGPLAVTTWLLLGLGFARLGAPPGAPEPEPQPQSIPA